MSFFDRFTKRWASNGAIAEPAQAQADQGFAFLGANPPTVEQFNALFQWGDDKDNWLYGQLAQVLRTGGITPGPTPDTQLLSALRTMFGGTGSVGEPGWVRLPGGLIMQWGSGGTVTGNSDIVTYPFAFPTLSHSPVVSEAHAAGWASGGFVTVFGTSDANKANFRLYVRGLDTTTGRFVPMPNVAYSWITIGW